MMLQRITKPLENSLKTHPQNDAEIHSKTKQKYNKLSDWGSHLAASFLSPFNPQGVFLATWFSEPLRGTPWTDFGLPGGTLDPSFLNSNIICKKIGPNVKDSRAAFQYLGKKMPPTTPSNNQARIKQQ